MAKVDGKTGYAFSKYVRHRNQLWIPTRKRVYLYWYKFLQIALTDDKYEVDMDAYKDWGTRDYILNTKFDDFWEEKWVELFSTKVMTDKPKFPPSTTRPKANAYKTRLAIYEYLKGTRLPKRFVHENILKMSPKLKVALLVDVDYSVDLITGEDRFDIQDIEVVRVAMNRHIRATHKHLLNVCKGSFP